MSETLESPKLPFSRRRLPIILGGIILLIITGGILAWQYFGVVEEEIRVPEERVRVEEEIIKDETADWKTYLNEEYEFGIKYHLRYQYNSYPIETDKPGARDWGFEFYEPGRNPFQVRIYEEQPLLEYYLGAYYFLDTSPPFEGWINPEIPTPDHRIISYVEPITFGVDNYQGIKGVSTIGMTDPHVSLIVFFQGKRNNVYVFEFPGYYMSELLPLEEEKWKEELKKKPNTKIFFQMLSTFRVIDRINISDKFYVIYGIYEDVIDTNNPALINLLPRKVFVSLSFGRRVDFRESAEKFFAETKGEAIGRWPAMIMYPRPNQKIKSPVQIELWARIGHYDMVTICIIDENHQTLASFSVPEAGHWNVLMHSYIKDLTYSIPTSEKGVIKGRSWDFMSRSEDLFEIPVVFEEYEKKP